MVAMRAALMAAIGMASVWSMTPLSAESLARKTLAGPVAATVLTVIDGDTLTVRAHIWVGQEVETHVRLMGVDTPELHGRCEAEKSKAQDAKLFTARLTSSGKVFLYDVRSDKYGGRVDATVRTEDGRNLADALIQAGLARHYGGGKRAAWCAG